MLALLDPISYDPQSSPTGFHSNDQRRYRWLFSSPLPLLAVGVVVGVLAHDLAAPRVHWAAALLPLALTSVAHWLAGRTRWAQLTLVCVGFCLGAAAGAVHYDLAVPRLQSYAGTAVVRVDDSISLDTEGNRRTTVIVEAFGMPDQPLSPVGQRYRVSLPDGMPPVARGGRYAVRGELRAPRPGRFPGAPDYKRFIKANGAVGTLRTLGPWVGLDAESTVLTGLDSHRQRAHQLLVRHSPGGVLPALALGQGRAVKPEIRELYGRCGLAHVLAVSGLHFGLVALCIFGVAVKLARRSARIARRWGVRRVAVLVALPLLLLYVLYVGAPVSARRACVMAVCLLLGHVFHREGHPVISLCAAALVILLLQPAEVFSPGFQLSFSAVLGLLWTAENYEKPIRQRLQDRFGRWSPPLEWVASSIIATLGASLTTLPFVLWHFGQVPLVGMLANLWVVPAVSFVLLPLSLASAGLVDIWPAAANVLAGWGGTCETWLTCSVQAFDALVPLVAVDTSQAVPVWMLVVYGCGCASWLLAPAHGWARYLAVPCLLLVFCCHVAWSSAPAHCGSLRVTFIAIGQGDATLLEFPDGRSMLIDAGGVPGGEYDTGARVVLPFLRSVGRSQVDIVVLTHPDFDHMGGLASVIRWARPSEVWTNQDALDTSAWQDLMLAVEDVGATHRIVDGSDAPMDFGGARLRILWPAPFDARRNRNDNSIVFRVDYGRTSFVLPGDAELDAERGMLASGVPLGATVLKSGHHGSRTSSSDAMLDAVSPEFLVHSVGEDNKFGFPHAEVTRRAVARGIETYRTDHHGTIRMETDGRRLVVETWLQ